MSWSGSQTATIADGQSLSDAIDLAEQRLTGIAIPTGWEAAQLTFQVSKDGAEFRELYDSAGAVSIPAGQLADDRYVLVDPVQFYSIRHLKIRSGTKAVPVPQVGGAPVQLLTGRR